MTRVHQGPYVDLRGPLFKMHNYNPRSTHGTLTYIQIVDLNQGPQGDQSLKVSIGDLSKRVHFINLILGTPLRPWILGPHPGPL